MTNHWMLITALALAITVSASGQAGAGQKNAPGSTPQSASGPANTDRNKGLTLLPAELPPTYPHGPYHVMLAVQGDYVPVLQWTVEKGTLPPGILLDDNGVLHGEAQRAGEFNFVLTASDGGKPQQIVRKEFTIKVVEAITLAWKVPAHVNVNRIEGSVDVSNTTPDDIDLTFDVKAVAENGRATEIGYQHFPLKKGTIKMTVPFGENLPHGAYLVRVDVTGENAKRQAIYKAAMQTPRPLQVVPGP